MHLDGAQIAIRERSLLETMDLGLQVVRRFGPLLVFLLALGCLPFAVLNAAVLSPLASELLTAAEDLSAGQEAAAAAAGTATRYLWWLTILTTLQAPLATAFMTVHLAHAAVQEKAAWWDAIVRSLQVSFRLLYTHGVVRGGLLLIPLLFWMEPTRFHLFLEFFVGGVLLGYNLLIRMCRPYVNEIILLERKPLIGNASGGESIARRSDVLHDDGSGDTVVRWLIGALFAVPITLAIFNVLHFVIGLLSNDWSWNAPVVYALLPLSLWLTAGFLTIVRYLHYLDRRIRFEGWEVEMTMRAEAARQAVEGNNL